MTAVRAWAPPPFQRFLDAHRDDVWRFLLASVGPAEADDCFQETFAAALKGYPRLRPDSNLHAWVLTIAHHKALDAHRRRTRGPVAVEQVQEAAAPAPPEGRDEELWAAVHALAPRQRAAVLLRFRGELSHREISEAIGCSEEAARRSLHEGLKRLREVWTDDRP